MMTSHAASAASPFGLFETAVANRRLIWRLAQREIEARYRGSVFGLFWSVLTPILMVATYSFVFTVVFQPRWLVPEGANANFVLLLYSGVLIYSIFSECVGRAATLVLENVSYVKKVVFPLEILPWVAMTTALVNFLIGMAVMLALYLAMLGLPPATILLLPLVVAPLVLFTLGVTWALAAVGVYLRDLRHVVGVLVSMLMFLSPIFYPVTAVPEGVRVVLYLNPITPILETSKDVLFWGRLPDPALLVGSLVAAWAVAWLGHYAFARLRRGFADVV